MLHWGLVPSWAREKSIGARMINARAETLGEKPSFRSAYQRRRCLVLADGWYEWQRTAARQAAFLHALRDGEPFGMAGLWESVARPGGGEPLESCASSRRSPLRHSSMSTIACPRSLPPARRRMAGPVRCRDAAPGSLLFTAARSRPAP